MWKLRVKASDGGLAIENNQDTRVFEGFLIIVTGRNEELQLSVHFKG